MVVTGTEGNPFYTLCQQLNTELHPLADECPLFHNGALIPRDVDNAVEELFNLVLDKASSIDSKDLLVSQTKVPYIYGKSTSIVPPIPSTIPPSSPAARSHGASLTSTPLASMNQPPLAVPPVSGVSQPSKTSTSAPTLKLSGNMNQLPYSSAPRDTHIVKHSAVTTESKQSGTAPTTSPAFLQPPTQPPTQSASSSGSLSSEHLPPVLPRSGDTSMVAASAATAHNKELPTTLSRKARANAAAAAAAGTTLLGNAAEIPPMTMANKGIEKTIGSSGQSALVTFSNGKPMINWSMVLGGSITSRTPSVPNELPQVPSPKQSQFVEPLHQRAHQAQFAPVSVGGPHVKQDPSLPGTATLISFLNMKETSFY